MALSGTEAEIINSVARLRKATKHQIKREVGFSLEYVGFLCRYLVRKGYLVFHNRHYSLVNAGIGTLLTEEVPEIDRKLMNEIAKEVSAKISGELKSTIKDIKIPLKEMRERKESPGQGGVEINTDFEFPLEDESLSLESNINRIGANLEREKSDIDQSIELFKQLQKRRKKR